jgi:hypothetical protein
MPVGTDEMTTCESGTCGNRRFVDGVNGWAGLCEPCAALHDEHGRGLHHSALTDCADCA